MSYQLTEKDSKDTSILRTRCRYTIKSKTS